jgi:uncharacterized membrane protein
MNTTQKWITIAFVSALALAAIRPPWQQTYKGVRLSYAGELGQHFLWQRPPATGEKSWMVVAPASECEVSIDERRLLWQCGVLLVIGALLLFVLRTRPRALGMNDHGTGVTVADWKYVSVAALVMICVAALVMFVIHPFGFEEAIGWLYILLPGEFVYAVNATDLDNLAPALVRNSVRVFVSLGVSLLWYFAVCDSAKLIYRLLASRFRNRGDPNS